MARARAWVAFQLRKWADRLDFDGAPKMTSWSFTIEREPAGVVFNSAGKGCPVWFYGNASYQRAHDEARLGGEVDLRTPEWATFGYRITKDEVMVLGSADLRGGSLSRRMDGYDEFAPVSRRTPYVPRNAKVPRWTITVSSSLRTFVQVSGKDYQAAIASMFGKAGRSG